jgi:hypothetical protein
MFEKEQSAFLHQSLASLVLIRSSKKARETRSEIGGQSANLAVEDLWQTTKRKPHPRIPEK